MRKIGYVLFVLVVALVATPTQDSQATQQNKLKMLMEDKLRFAKVLLEGVALGDFNKITDSSEKLIQISKSAEWFVYKTPRYELHSNEFRRAAENVIAKAKAKNMDGVAFSYVELTMTCFRCHEYVRDVRDVNWVDPNPQTRKVPAFH
jgi:hypothetical protein